MASKLPSTLIKDFSKLINERQTNPTPQYLKGTAKISGDKKYVQIDGSSSLTPIAETVDIQEGDRVLVSIENHKATVLGNFTFPPNARKEQEAVDKADEAITDSNVALENATEAKQNAATAMENASAAQSSAAEAIGKAENAMENVETAITKAETAISDASNAKELANQAADKATESLESVSAAQNEIDQIQNEVGTVQEDINQALADLAEQAGELETIQTNLSTNYATKTELGTVEAELNQTITSSISELSTSISQTYAAKTDVVEMTGALQTQITQNTESISSQASKIETIEADTAAAQEAVEEAKSAANQAQTIANEAKTNANTAIANAATAQNAANQAQEDADAAAQAASTAQQKADAADQAVQQAQNDLAEAEANLASVTTRVDATEEEIAEAQQAVEQAQQEVDQALADAATANYAAQQAAQAAQTAQDTADTAKTNAEYAQTAADNAQASADNAQAAADKAQEDVAALTKRVTTAETNIEQNAEQISLNASKTEEIGNLLENNYYSKEETEAAIDVAADQITSEVTSTVETTVKEEIEKIEVGARNLFLNSSFKVNLDEWKTDYVGKPEEPVEPEEPTIDNLLPHAAFNGTDSAIPTVIDSSDGMTLPYSKSNVEIGDYWTYSSAIASATSDSSGQNPTLYFGLDEETSSYHLNIDAKNNYLIIAKLYLSPYSQSYINYFKDELYPSIKDSLLDSTFVLSIDYKKIRGDVTYPSDWSEENISAIEELYKSHFLNYNYIQDAENILTITEGNLLLEDSSDFVTKTIKFKFLTDQFANAEAFAGVLINLLYPFYITEYISSTYDLYFKNFLFYKEETTEPETPTEKPKIYVNSTLVEDGGTYQAGNAEGASVRCECKYDYTWTYRGGEQPSWGDSQWLVKNTDPNGNVLSVKDIYNNQTTITIFFTNTVPETLSDTDPLEDTDPPEDVDIYTDPLTNITSCRIISNNDASVCQDVSPRLSIEDAAKIYTISGDFKLDNYVASETSKAELFFKGDRSVSEIPNLLDHSIFDGSDPEIPETIVPASAPADNGWLFSASYGRTIVYDDNEKAYHANIDGALDWYFQQEITSKVQDATVDDVYIFEIIAKVSGTNPTNSFFRFIVLDRDNGTSNINKLTPENEFLANSNDYVTYQYKFKFNDVSNLTDIQAGISARCTSNGGVPINIYFKKFAIYKETTTPISKLVPITVTTQSGLADLTQYFGKGWVESKWTVELSGIPNYLTTNEYLDVGIRVFDFVGDLYFKNLKLEKGNKMTDWTPAPEDQEDQLEDAILENNETVRQNYTSLINQQADRISALISRVDSTEDSLSSIETSVSNKIEITEEDISLIKETITTLENAVSGQMSVQELIEWIRIEGASMTLGKSDSKIVGKLTNDRLTFMNGDKEVAYFSAEGMYVFQAIIAKQLTCGAYSWVDEEALGFSLV